MPRLEVGDPARGEAGGKRAFALALYTHANPPLDVWAAWQGREPFERVFGVPVEIRVAA